MTPEELYFFDTNGYLLIEDVVPEDMLEEGIAASKCWESELNLRFPNRPAPEGALPGGAISQIATKEPIYLCMALLPKILGPTVSLVDSPKLKTTWLSYSLLGGAVEPHGNHMPFNPGQAYMFVGGRPFASLLLFIFALSEIPEDGGALNVIPGSHKSNFEAPKEGRLLDSMWRKVPQPQGSALMISHDILHGSLCERDIVRRTLHVGYGPGCMVHGDDMRNDLLKEVCDQAPEGSWRRYLLRQPGMRDSCPKPEYPVAHEFDEIMKWRPHIKGSRLPA